MVDKCVPRRRGRPPAFAPDDALDAAVRIFWRSGFDGADLDEIAAAVGATKPSLYRRFGDKRTLFRRALERYKQTTGGEALGAFLAEADIRAATRAFLATTMVNVSGARGPKGCMIACVASQAAETMDEVRAFCAEVQAQGVEVMAARFRREVEGGHLAPAPAPEVRARTLLALMQGAALRARHGEDYESLMAGLDDTVALVLATVEP